MVRDIDMDKGLDMDMEMGIDMDLDMSMDIDMGNVLSLNDRLLKTYSQTIFHNPFSVCSL